MIVSPIVYSKIKEVVFQIYEPERRKDVMWGKPADEYYDFYLYVDGHWELIEGIGSSKVPVVPCNLSAFVNDAGYLSGSNVAYVENSSTASKSYSEGDYLIYGSTLYKATTAINEGDTIEVGVNVVSTTLTDEIGSGGGGGLQSFEIIECNVTSVDSSGVATVSNTNWFTQAVAAYNNHKLPIVNGTYNYAHFAVQLTVVEGSPYNNCYGSTAVTEYIGSGQVRMFAINFMAAGNYPLVYVHDLQQKLTFDNTPTAGSPNPVSSAGVKTYVDNAVNAGTPQQVHTNEVAATLASEEVHVFAGTTDTLAITLTAPTDTLSHLYTVILTTGTTPAVSIHVSDSTAIIYPDDYAIEAETTYEISVLVVNGKYYLRYVTYQEA